MPTVSAHFDDLKMFTEYLQQLVKTDHAGDDLLKKFVFKKSYSGMVRYSALLHNGHRKVSFSFMPLKASIQGVELTVESADLFLREAGFKVVDGFIDTDNEVRLAEE